MIAIGIEHKGVGNTFAVIPPRLTSFDQGAMAVSNIVLAYNSQIAFPSIIDEMKEPRDFPKALAMLQCVTIPFYVLVAVVIYYYAGQDVQAPAIGSAPILVRKIAYGIATPTIIVAGVIAALVAAKQIYGDIWKNKAPKIETEKTTRAYGSWYGILAALWVVAWLIAEAIPVFHQLLAVIGALFGTWFALGFCSMFWLSMNWKGSVKASYGANWRKTALAGLNVCIILLSVAIVSTNCMSLAYLDHADSCPVRDGDVRQHQGYRGERQNRRPILMRQQRSCRMSHARCGSARECQTLGPMAATWAQSGAQIHVPRMAICDCADLLSEEHVGRKDGKEPIAT